MPLDRRILEYKGRVYRAEKNPEARIYAWYWTVDGKSHGEVPLGSFRTLSDALSALRAYLKASNSLLKC